jgi:hypothetical protein
MWEHLAPNSTNFNLCHLSLGINERKTVSKKTALVIELEAMLGVCAGYVPPGGHEHTHSFFGNCTGEQ